jgi:oxalate decarboxylase
MLIGFNAGYYQAIDASQWLAGVPAHLLADHFGLPNDLLDKFPHARAFIAPPDGSGKREIK